MLPRPISSSQMITQCFGIQMEASFNCNSLKTSLVPRYSLGTRSLFFKQPLNKHTSPLGALLTSKTQDISSSPPFVGDEKIGVLLLNLGGPETLDDVQPFLFNLFADPVIFSFFSFVVFSCSIYMTTTYWSPIFYTPVVQIKSSFFTRTYFYE